MEEWQTWYNETPYEQKLETTEAASKITVNVVSDNLEFTTVADNKQALASVSRQDSPLT